MANGGKGAPAAPAYKADRTPEKHGYYPRPGKLLLDHGVNTVFLIVNINTVFVIVVTSFLPSLVVSLTPLKSSSSSVSVSLTPPESGMSGGRSGAHTPDDVKYRPLPAKVGDDDYDGDHDDGYVGHDDHDYAGDHDDHDGDGDDDDYDEEDEDDI